MFELIIAQANQITVTGLEYSNKHDHESALCCYQQAIVLYQQVQSDVRKQIADILDKTGDAHINLLQFNCGMSAYHSSLTLYRMVPGAEMNVASTLDTLGELYFHMFHDLDRAKIYISESCTIMCTLAGPDSEVLAEEQALLAEINAAIAFRNAAAMAAEAVPDIAAAGESGGAALAAQEIHVGARSLSLLESSRGAGAGMQRP